MTEKLKPCPFCGGRGEVHRSNMYGGNKGKHFLLMNTLNVMHL